MKKTVKKIVAVLIAIICTLPLCSCNLYVFKSAGDLLTPPELIKDQRDITKALKKSAGESIVLEYPSQGDFRSAFVSYDVDGDKYDEIIAFYRTDSGDGEGEAVHINLLDRKDGRWISACDIVGEATGIDRVSIGNLGGACTVVIGWELIKSREKTLVCYRLENSTLRRVYSDSYIEFALSDFYSENEGDELILLNYNETDEVLVTPSQSAKLIAVDGKNFYTRSSVSLDFRVTGYKNVLCGNYEVGKKGLFLDGVIGQNLLNEQILICDENGELQNPLLVGSVTAETNVHRATVLSQDTNLDGIVEVPRQEAFRGYENMPESEIIYKTVWSTLNGTSLKDTLTTYVNTVLGVKIKLDDETVDKITLKADLSSGEIVFYRFENSLEESREKLFTVFVTTKNSEPEIGFETVEISGDIAVYVKSENENDFGIQKLRAAIELI